MAVRTLSSNRSARAARLVRRPLVLACRLGDQIREQRRGGRAPARRPPGADRPGSGRRPGAGGPSRRAWWGPPARGAPRDRRRRSAWPGWRGGRRPAARSTAGRSDQGAVGGRAVAAQPADRADLDAGQRRDDARQVFKLEDGLAVAGEEALAPLGVPLAAVAPGADLLDQVGDGRAGRASGPATAAGRRGRPARWSSQSAPASEGSAARPQRPAARRWISASSSAERARRLSVVSSWACTSGFQRATVQPYQGCCSGAVTTPATGTRRRTRSTQPDRALAGQRADGREIEEDAGRGGALRKLAVDRERRGAERDCRRRGGHGRRR